MTQPARNMEFWHNRWHSKQTGWHRPEYNDLLVKYWPTINVHANCEVLVPLCGKSLDMIWLAEQGHRVTGLEMVEKAVETFFSENELEYSTTENSTHKIHSSKPYKIFQGNFFDLEKGVLKVDAWYDRAAMIAINPSDRKAYVKQIRNQTNSGAVGLLITFAYPQEQMAGPPFALQDSHVYDLFSEGFEVECLENIQLEDDRDRGLSNVTSTVFRINRI